MSTSLALGLANWVFDAYIDWKYYYTASFIDLLILDVPSHELFVRLGELVSIMIFGVIMSVVLTARARAESALVKARDELETKVSERTEDLRNANERLSSELRSRALAEDALSSENEFRRAIEESILAGILVTDMQGKITHVNPAFSKMVGWTREELVGTVPPFPYWPAECAEEMTAAFWECMSRPEEGRTEAQFCKRNGELMDVLILSSQLRDGRGEQIGFLRAVYDITERKRMEMACRANEERFRVALGTSPVMVFNQDADLRYTWIHNPAPGFDADAVVGRTDAELLAREDAERLTEIKRRVLQSGIRAEEIVQITKGGETRYYDLTVEPLRNPAGHIVGITCVAADVTGHKHEEQALVESEVRLRRLFFELMSAQEDERKRVSGELHDEIAQLLALVIMRVRRAKDGLRQDQQAPAEECDLAVEYLCRAIDSMRRLSDELCPPIIADLGLTIAINRLVNEYRSRSGLAIISSIADIDSLLPRSSQMALYRLLQECLENIVTHAYARNVGVTLTNDGSHITLHVTDDGRGFDLIRTRTRRSAGSGIAVMEERAIMLGGILSISSEQGRGTDVALTVPAADAGKVVRE
jgi:PAS domain S-box-containing protein